MKVDFKSLLIELNLEGDKIAVDIRRQLGNAIYQNTNDIGFADFGRTIYYSDGEIEVPEEYINSILSISKMCFVVSVQKALNKLLKDNK